MYIQQQQHQTTPTLFQVPTCTICIQKMSQDLSVLKCGHVFHEECIRHCIAVSRQCPICKDRIHSEKDVKKLYFDLHENKTTQQHIHRILEQLSGEDIGANAFNKAIVKLRKALSQNQALSQKLKEKQQENVQLLRKEEEFLKGAKFMQTQLKQCAKLKRNLQMENQSLKQYISLMDGEKQDLQLKIKSQESQLGQFRMYKKTQVDINKDNKHYQVLKHQYLTNNPNEGVDYFCQLAEGLKLDVRRLQKNIQTLQTIIKQQQFKASDYKRELQDYKSKLHRQVQGTKIWKDKYYKTFQKALALKQKLKDKSIQTDITIQQNSNPFGFKKQADINVPRMMSKKETSSEDIKTEKNPFAEFGSGVRRLQKKKVVNSFLF